MSCDCFVQNNTELDEILEYVNESEESVEEDKKSSWTALHHAAGDNVVHEVEALLTRHPTMMSAITDDGKTAFILAIENGSVESFLCFMKFQHYVSLVHEMLPVAIGYDQLGIVDAMIPYLKEKKALREALHLATQLGRVHILCALSRFIPSDFIVDEVKKRTLFHVAAKSDQVEVLRYLGSICPSEVIVAKDRRGNTQLHAAIGTHAFDAFQFIIDAHPQLLVIVDKDDYAPFMSALFNQNVRVVYYMLDRFPQCVYLQTKHGETPLHLAPCVHIAKRLHAMHPTMIDDQPANRETPLHAAIFTGDIQLVEYLLTLWPSAISAKDRYNRTPLYHAQLQQFDAAVKKFITLMPDLDDVDSQDNTVLHITVKHFSLQEDESTLQRVFDTHTKDIKTPNKGGDTPYHIALLHNNRLAIRMYEHSVAVADMFDIHTQYNPLDTSQLQRSVAKECMSLDIYLLPDLNFLVQEFLETRNKKRKL